jgi:hypothetical protein
MKTARDWLDSTLLLSGSYNERIRRIADIQLDAFKAGAEWAAKQAKETPDKEWCGLGSVDKWELNKAILNAAANLKEIPK